MTIDDADIIGEFHISHERLRKLLSDEIFDPILAAATDKDQIKYILFKVIIPRKGVST